MIGLWAGLLALMPTQAITVSDVRPIDTIVVCPDGLREALQPWVQLREAQGHQLAFARHSDSAQQVQREIRRLAIGQSVRWILLVGDAPLRNARLPVGPSLMTGTFYQAARAISKWGPDREIATDSLFADFDDDGLPDAAIGRLTADSPRDLSIMVRKIIDFETAQFGNLARHKVHLIAGVGGFGQLIDATIESLTKKMVTEDIPEAYQTTMTYGSWRSPFCPDPRRFHDVTIDRFNEGGLFWVYIGHGQRSALDEVRVPGARYHILDINDVPKLKCRDCAPIAVFLACYTGAFDAQRDCLAEEMLRADGGPVAVVSGSRMTMPYAMAVMSSSMMYECFQKHRETLGEVMMYAKRSMMEEITDEKDPRYAQRRLLDGVASVMTMNANKSLLQDERRDHVALFQILGDPLLRLREPLPIEVKTDEQVEAGTDLSLTIRSPLIGHCTLELACRRDSWKVPLLTRSEFDDSERSLEGFNTDYRQANDLSWQTISLNLNKEEVVTKISIPAEARGHCVLRAHVASANGEGLGSTAVLVVPRKR